MTSLSSCEIFSSLLVAVIGTDCDCVLCGSHRCSLGSGAHSSYSPHRGVAFVFPCTAVSSLHNQGSSSEVNRLLLPTRSSLCLQRVWKLVFIDVILSTEHSPNHRLETLDKKLFTAMGKTTQHLEIKQKGFCDTSKIFPFDFVGRNYFSDSRG